MTTSDRFDTTDKIEGNLILWPQQVPRGQGFVLKRFFKYRPPADLHCIKNSGDFFLLAFASPTGG
jgi:hypothetical protein